MLSRFFDLAVIKRRLLFKKGAELVTTSNAGVESVVDMSELGALNVTAGTGAASKALVLDSSGNVTMPSGSTFTAVGLSSTGNTALGNGAADTVSMYGGSGKAQTSAPSAILTVAAITAAGAYGFSTAAQANGILTELHQIRSDMVAMGWWA